MFIRQIILFCTILCISECYKILAVFPTPSHSHHTLASKLVKELAKTNHEVTFVNPFPSKEMIPNLKEISVEEITVAFNSKYLTFLKSEIRKFFRFRFRLGFLALLDTKLKISNLKNFNLVKKW